MVATSLQSLFFTSSSSLLLVISLFFFFFSSFVPLVSSTWTPPSYDMRFVDKELVKGLDKPVGAEFARDGSLYYWQKSGKVYVKPRNRTALTLIDISSELSDLGDRGLLGFTLHPNFHFNGYFYLLYTVRPAVDSFSLNKWTWSRITRFQASLGTNRTKLVPGSRKVLLGATKEDGIPVCSIAHSVGTLKFGHDGMLYVSHGDGSAFDRPDWGNDAQCSEMFGDQDVGSYRSQSINSMAGKILRIDPNTGMGLRDNPFYVAGRPLNAPSSRIWALGFRNPFRMALKPKDASGQTVFFVCDNGAATWEEITIVTKGTNAGWPCYEGPEINPDFNGNDSFCSRTTMVGRFTLPQMYWHHWDGSRSYPRGLTGASTTGIEFYQGTTYPNGYKKTTNLQTFFFCDYANNWMKAGFVNSQNQIVGFSDFFSTPNPVFIGSSPYVYQGEIFYVSYYDDTINLIHYSLSSLPIVTLSSNTTAPGINRPIQFYSDGTYDPGNGVLRLLWRFGDGTSSTSPNPIHRYTKKGNFTVTLTAINSQGASTRSSMRVTTWVPTPWVTKPSLKSLRYTAGSKITPVATHSLGTKLSWDLQLVHNGHSHPETAVSKLEKPTFTLSSDTNIAGERFSYRLVVTATDSMGNKATSQVSLYGTNTNLAINRAAEPALNLIPSTPKSNQAVLFDASGSMDYDLDYLEFSWNFGDGTGNRSTGDQPMTRHIFRSPGVYVITLAVKETFGKISYLRKRIYVHPTSMIGAWHFEENMGTISADSSNNGATISLNNTNWLFLGTGTSKSALQFTGSKKSSAVIKSTPILSKLAGAFQVNFRIETWYNEGANWSWIRIMSKKGTDSTGFEILYNPATASLGFQGSGTSRLATSKPGSVPRWKWAQVQVRVSKTGVVDFLVNDVKVNNIANMSTVVKPNSIPIRLGRSSLADSGFFNGLLDDLVIYQL